MKTLLIIFTLITTTSIAQSSEININTPIEAEAWCKSKSTEYFLAKKLTPSNWSSSLRNEGDIINIKGYWKANNIEYIVKCRIEKGLKEKSALITINEKTSNN